MSHSSDKPLVLVDGSSYLFRAYHALPPLTSPDGEPTGAMYGVLNMLRKLFDEYQPERFAVVFDASGKTFRDELYPEYKSNRPPMPDDLRAQIEPLHEIVRAMGIPILVVPGVEADDVIGTLARRAEAQGRSVVISTGDKDLAQLVTDRITLLDTMKDSVMDEEAVQRKFGVPPDRIVDLLALVGDSVDNIPGVPKVGPKTAAKWLSEFGSVDGVMAAANEIKGKVGENLRVSLQQLPLSRELATIRCDVDLEVGPSDLERSDPDRESLAAYYRRFGFNSWLRQLESGTGVEDDVDAPGDGHEPDPAPSAGPVRGARSPAAFQPPSGSRFVGPSRPAV